MNLEQYTEISEVNDLLSTLLSEVKNRLKDNLVGAYLQGSFAYGDFDSHSDIDFIIVVRKRLSETEVDDLRKLHLDLHESGAPWATCLEGSYVPMDLFRTPFDCDEEIWYKDNGTSELILSTHDNTLVVRDVLFRRGVTLAGPTPRAFIDPVDRDDLRDEIRRISKEWGNQIIGNPDIIGSQFFQSFAVLHFCRAWHDIQKGAIHSKKTGATWAADQLEEPWQDLIKRSWSGRPDPDRTSKTPADPQELELTVDFVRMILEKL